MSKYLAWALSPISFLFLAVPVFAQTPVPVNPCPTSGIFNPLCNLQTGDFGSLIGVIVNLIFVIAIVVAVLYLIYGGIKWIMSRGDKTQIEDARNHVVASVVGLIVVFLAFFIINILLGFFLKTSINNLSIPSLPPFQCNLPNLCTDVPTCSGYSNIGFRLGHTNSSCPANQICCEKQ